MDVFTSKFRCGIILAITCSLALAGCGQGEFPDLGAVEGTVTLDGAPLEGARVKFRPESGRASFAKTDQQGHYTLTYLRDVAGAKTGKHRVIISTYREGEVFDETSGVPIPTIPERVPAKYNRDSILTADVQPGGNVCDFDLKSSG